MNTNRTANGDGEAPQGAGGGGMNTSWKRTTLGEDIDLISGQHLNPHEYDEGETGIPYLTGPADFADGRFQTTKRALQPKIVCQRGDILLTVKGSGTGTLIVADQQYCISRQLMAVRPRTWDHGFVYWILSLHSEKYQNAASGLIPGITREHVLGTVLPLPPLPEQRAIAGVLSTWDRGIRQLADLIAAKLRFKQGLMQQLLTGKRRFPEFTDEWETVRIGSFLTENRVSGTHGAEAKKLTVKLYGKGVIPNADTRAGSSATKYYRRNAGQFIYSKLDFLNGAFGIIPKELDGYESTLDLPAFDVAETVNPDWFLYFVIRKDFYKNLLGLANGGRKARRVNPDDLLKVTIPCPSLPEQQRIAAVLNAADREIDLLRRQLTALKQQKRGLMQKLLTGEIRVKGPSSSETKENQP